MVFKTLNEILSYYSILLAGFGTFGNLLSLVVCMRKSLRKTPTFIFIAFMVVLDALSLYFWNLNTYFGSFHGFALMDQSPLSCMLTNFFQMFSLQASSYILVCN